MICDKVDSHIIPVGLALQPVAETVGGRIVPQLNWLYTS